MPAGLEIFSADGTLTLGLTTRTSRVLGVIESAGGYKGAAGSLSHDGFLTGTPFFIVTPMGGGAIPIFLEVKVTGTTLTWGYTSPGGYPPAANFLLCNILYGVY